VTDSRGGYSTLVETRSPHRATRIRPRHVHSRDWLSAPPMMGILPAYDGCPRVTAIMASLSYAHGTSTTPLLGETIGENLRRTVKRFPDHEALVVRHQNVRMTYRELWDATTQMARELMGLGLAKGDRVGIWAPNRYEWVVVQYATARIGAILVNINPAYK